MKGRPYQSQGQNCFWLHWTQDFINIVTVKELLRGEKLPGCHGEGTSLLQYDESYWK